MKLQEQGKFAAAFDLLKHCETIDPQAAEVYYAQAAYYAELNNDSMALACMKKAADLIRGKKVADHVRFLVVPASRDEYEKALEEGVLDVFMKAGAIVMNPNCSVCWGSCQGVIGEGEVLVSTGTRNFKGRAGHKGSFVYLASALTVAASAVAGEITEG